MLIQTTRLRVIWSIYRQKSPRRIYLFIFWRKKNKKPRENVKSGFIYFCEILFVRFEAKCRKLEGNLVIVVALVHSINIFFLFSLKSKKKVLFFGNLLHSFSSYSYFAQLNLIFCICFSLSLSLT